MALFITFEGGEGSGKSTQAKTLYRRLYRLAIPVLLTHEPGVTFLGKRIARLLKWMPDIDISPLAELLLFNASRAQLVAEVIRPNLQNGKIVILRGIWNMSQRSVLLQRHSRYQTRVQKKRIGGFRMR